MAAVGHTRRRRSRNTCQSGNQSRSRSLPNGGSSRPWKKLNSPRAKIRKVTFLFNVTNRTIDKARREIENGNLWRAKEILQGAIGSESYDVQLFEMLGTVFLRMGDLPEAGRLDRKSVVKGKSGDIG